MQKRAAAIGAGYSFQSQPGKGTNVCLQLKMPQ
jgi:signal transduction histidine kinase